MANAENTAAVAEIVDNLRSANAAMLTEYRGLDVKQLKELRRSLGDNASYAVVKNTLTKIAAKEVGIEGLDADLQGPTAITYVTGEPVEVAKALRDFAKANPALVIKSGVLEGSPLTAADINKLADLDSREVLLAKAAGAMKGKLNQTAYMLVALPSQAVRVIEALRQKVESEGPATSVVEPVAESSAPPAAVAEDAAEAPAATESSAAVAEPETTAATTEAE